MKAVICNYCGRNDSELVNEGPDLLMNRPGRYRLVRCRHCDLIYQSPQLALEELIDHYPNDYQPYQRSLENERSLVKRFDRSHEMARRYDRIRRYFPEPGQLLEVGCSTGLFLVAMREHGWRVMGVELSDYAADIARQAHGLDVTTGSLESAMLPANAYEVVTLWDVFEHVVDPKATLAEIGRVLKPGGLLVASVPNPTSVEARIFGSHWVGWDRPRHLHLFTPDVIRRYLDDAGFEAPVIESFSGRLGVTLMSIEFWAKARGISAEKWRPWTKLAYSAPFRLATWPLYRLAGAINQTSIMTIFARRGTE